MLVVLVRTDVLEERISSIIRVKRIGELGTTLAVTSNRRTLRRNTVTHSIFCSVRRLLGGAIFLRNVGSYKSHYVVYYFFAACDYC
jgi:hypothetical protein